MGNLKERLQQIKDEVAKESGWSGFNPMMELGAVFAPNIDEICKRYAAEVIKEASERMNMTLHDGHFKKNSETSYVQIGANNIQPNKQSILNLIKEI